jgi:hypothetical protein
LESNNIFLTTNNGVNWTAVGLQNFYLYSLAVSGTTLYAGTIAMQDNHILRSNDYGGNWTNVSNGLLTTSAIRSIITKGSSIFAATEEVSRNNVYRSTNNGDNWYVSNTGIRYQLVLSLASVGSNIFAGTCVGGIYTSTNNGINWTTVNNGLPNIPINVLASSGVNLFAGVGGTGNLNYGIYRSVNNGVNWTPGGLLHYKITQIVIDGSNIYAGGNSELSSETVFHSTDNGNNWTAIGSSFQNITALAVSGSSIFAAYNNDSLYRTTNNGVNWTGVNNGIPTLYNINALTIIGNHIFAGGIGVYLSTNNGNNWTSVSTGLPEAENSYVTRFATSGTYIFAGLDYVFQGIPKLIYLSTNYGTTWLNKSQGLDSISTWIPSMLITNNYIFAGTDISSGQGDFGTSVWRRSYSEIIEIKKISTEIPYTFSLFQNYPNPFNPSTNIKYQIPKNSFVSLKVFDLLGREVQTLVNEKQSAGIYEATFDGTNLSSGIYFYKIESPDFSKTMKMVLVK